jgi:hypothetical protein
MVGPAGPKRGHKTAASKNLRSGWVMMVTGQKILPGTANSQKILSVLISAHQV